MSRKPSFLTVVVWSLIVASIGGEQKGVDDKTGLSCTITPAKSTVLPFESIEFIFTVRNQTDEAKPRVSGSFRPWILYPVKRDWFRSPQGVEADGIKWDEYQTDKEAFIQAPFNVLSFEPKEAKKWVKVLEYEKGEHKLARPGQYLFKGTIDKLICNKVEIIVQEPAGVDAAAYGYLQQHPLHYFLHEQTIWKYSYDRKTAEEIEDFIAQFRGSQYADMAKLGLALMWIKGVEAKKDLELAQSLLVEVARSSDQARAARANYYLGQIAEERGELIDAQQYYNQALTMKADPYIEFVTKEAQTKLEPRLARPQRKPPHQD